MKITEINLRDPFILPHEGRYYLYGSTNWGDDKLFLCYISDDLKEWSEPVICFRGFDGFWGDRDFWAPEVHKYNGKFYMFATFYVEDKSRCRGVNVLVADRPEGPYVPNGEPITPADWMCLDGTLYVENGIPYMVFCHEWAQVKNGEMCLVQLSEDLTRTVSEPKLLFKAADPEWVPKNDNGDYVTDGPFLYNTQDGKLIMLWSTFGNGGYAEAVAVSDDGTINGKWNHCALPLSASNGGHGMLFKDFGGKLYFTMHAPNDPRGAERVCLFEMEEIPKEPYLRFKEV